jgi:hypothetical protein
VLWCCVWCGVVLWRLWRLCVSDSLSFFLLPSAGGCSMIICSSSKGTIVVTARPPDRSTDRPTERDVKRDGDGHRDVGGGRLVVDGDSGW